MHISFNPLTMSCIVFPYVLVPACRKGC